MRDKKSYYLASTFAIELENAKQNNQLNNLKYGISESKNSASSSGKTSSHENDKLKQNIINTHKSLENFKSIGLKRKLKMEKFKSRITALADKTNLLQPVNNEPKVRIVGFAL